LVVFGLDNGEPHKILAFKPDKVDSQFLLFFVASDGFIKICTAMSYGAKMPRVNYPKQLALLPVCLPPREEQQAIARYLEQRCGKLDAVIAIKQQQIKTLDALRQSIIYQAVTKGLDDSVPLVDSGIEWLGKIPQGWHISKLKYITEQIVDGTHFTPTYVESGIPFLRVTDIQTKFIDLESVKFISHEEHTELTKRAKPEKGDVLLSKNGTIGITKVVDWDWEFSIFVSLCLIKLLPNIDPYYFSYFFESDVVNQQLFESSKKNLRNKLTFSEN
jgi:type I restriction enzyme S subunit